MWIYNWTHHRVSDFNARGFQERQAMKMKEYSDSKKSEIQNMVRAWAEEFKENTDTNNIIYQLKITLKDIKPPIWRRVLVPQNITFYKLHKIIQAAFGWQDYHLFDFDFGDVAVHIPDPDYAPGELHGGIKELNAKRTKIDGLLVERRKCIYIYDFGDDWRHEVVLEKILPVEEGKRYPVCIDGARHRPPEDVGGVPGYEEFLSIIRNPRHPEHDDYLVWAEKDTNGRKFDPEYFYINEINRALAKIR